MNSGAALQRPSQAFTEELYAMSSGQRIELLSRLLIREICLASQTKFLTVELRVTNAEMTDLRIVQNYKTKELLELQ